MAPPEPLTRNPAAAVLANVTGKALDVLAAALVPQAAGDAAAADLLAELLVILRLHDGLSRGVIPPARSVKARSRAVADLEAALARAVRRYRDAPSAGMPPNAPPAGLEDGVTRAGADLQTPRGSAQDVIDLDQAAPLLGVRSRERARQLVREHELASWRNPGGRHELQVYRGEVIALGEQRSGGNGGTGGTGGREDRRADPGRTAGGSPAGGDSAA